MKSACRDIQWKALMTEDELVLCHGMSACG